MRQHPAKISLLPLAAGAALTIVIAAGCNRDGVKVYKVNADDSVATTPPPVAATSPGAMPATMPDGLPAPDNSGLPKLKYTTPNGWKEKPLSQLRVASFEITDSGKSADVSVIPLGAMSGGDAANVNRWRGQVGLTAEDDAAIKQSAEPVQVGTQAADMFDIAGTAPGSGDAERIIGTILHGDQATWYFKMMGDANLVEQNKAAFVAFLKSVDFEGQSGAPTAMDMSQLPPSHPAIPGMASDISTAAANKPIWDVPLNWQAGELMQFLVARYVIPGAGDASASVNVSQLDGDGGGLVPNLNRWRAQIGDAAITEADAAKLPTIDASGTKAVVADYTGTDARTGKPARVIGVVLPLGNQTWFYKLMGDPELVGQQKEPFIKFVESAQYPAAK